MTPRFILFTQNRLLLGLHFASAAEKRKANGENHNLPIYRSYMRLVMG